MAHDHNLDAALCCADLIVASIGDRAQRPEI
jgi:hypothetical protein